MRHWQNGEKEWFLLSLEMQHSFPPKVILLAKRQRGCDQIME
jgi:hypothetical protein